VTKQRPPATGSFRRLLTIPFDGGTASVYGGAGGCFRLEQRQGAARDVSGACGGDARLVNILTASTSKAGTYLVVGHVRRGATLELRFATLPPRRLRLAEGYFLTTFEKGSRPTRWIVRDAAGHVAGHVAGTQAFASRLP
jgi:hypothetical protein